MSSLCLHAGSFYGLVLSFGQVKFMQPKERPNLFWPPNVIGLYRGHMTLTWPKLNSNPQKPLECKISSHLVCRGLGYRHPRKKSKKPDFAPPLFTLLFFYWMMASLTWYWGWVILSGIPCTNKQTLELNLIIFCEFNSRAVLTCW